MPNILGMTFLRELSPVIDFSARSVKVGQHQLQVVPLNKCNVLESALTPTSNSFADLAISDVTIVGENGVGATQKDDLPKVL